MTSRILITDIAWPDLDTEREVLSAVDGELMLAGGGSPEEIIALAPQADAILTCWKDVPAEALDIAPNCRIVSRYGIGLDNIPIGRATELGMLVTNVPDFCLEEVSDHVMALLLATARQLFPLARRPDRSGWSRGYAAPHSARARTGVGTDRLRQHRARARSQGAGLRAARHRLHAAFASRRCARRHRCNQ